jgi:CheY-like chemotaxis protein
MRVLIVDDDTVIREVFAQVVGALGNDVTRAGDGHEALRILRAGEVDLLVTDFNMPVMDGAALIREVRQNQAALPIVLITGEPEAVPRDVLVMERLLVLRKPISHGQLVAAIVHEWPARTG